MQQQEPGFEQMGIKDRFRGSSGWRRWDVAARSDEPNCEPSDHAEAVQYTARLGQAGTNGGVVDESNGIHRSTCTNSAEQRIRSAS